MRIEKLHTPESVKEECVVVIDVLRAFTTTAYAFAAGAKKILLVSSIEEAFTLRSKFKDALLMGEVDGNPVQGFDFGNSPSEIQKQNLKGKTLIHRTSAGTQGTVRSFHSKKILVASFAVALATIKRILSIQPEKVTFIITGKNTGDEDLAFADYLETCLLQKKEVDPSPFLRRVIESPSSKLFMHSQNPSFPKADLDAAITLDFYPFAMEIAKEDGLLALYPVNEHGKVQQEPATLYY